MGVDRLLTAALLEEDVKTACEYAAHVSGVSLRWINGADAQSLLLAFTIGVSLEYITDCASRVLNVLGMKGQQSARMPTTAALLAFVVLFSCNLTLVGAILSAKVWDLS